MKTAENLTDADIDNVEASAVEGTATDALIRHACRVARGDQCIGLPPDGKHLRRPSQHERHEAKKRVARILTTRHQQGE